MAHCSLASASRTTRPCCSNTAVYCLVGLKRIRLKSPFIKHLTISAWNELLFKRAHRLFRRSFVERRRDHRSNLAPPAPPAANHRRSEDAAPAADARDGEKFRSP